MREGDEKVVKGKKYVRKWRHPRGIKDDPCYYCTGCANCNPDNPDNYVWVEKPK